jgi:hypothetical protein
VDLEDRTPELADAIDTHDDRLSALPLGPAADEETGSEWHIVQRGAVKNELRVSPADAPSR